MRNRTVRSRLIGPVIIYFIFLPLIYAEEPDPAILITGDQVTITEADYRHALLGLPEEQRVGIERDPNLVRDFLINLYLERRLMGEAERLGLDQQPQVAAVLERARRKVLAQALAEHVRAQVDLPDFDELAHEYYLGNRDKFMEPESVQVSHLLLKADCECEGENDEKRQQAEELLSQLREGADFAALAIAHSDDKASAVHGGRIMADITRGQMVEPFEEAAFALREPGELSDVVKTRFGYHIIKLHKYQPEKPQPFEQVKRQIVEKLKRDYLANAQNEFIAEYYPEEQQLNEAAIEGLAAKESESETSQK